MAPGESDAGDVPDGVIASALEFAVGIAAVGAKLRPPLSFPAELRPFLKFTRLPATARSHVRAAVHADRVFLDRLALAAKPELVDEAGLLWLQRGEGWQERLAALSALAPRAGHDAAADLRRAERRRQAAELAARRAVAEVVALRVELDRRATAEATMAEDVEALRRERDALREQARAHQADQRRSLGRVAAAEEQLEQRRVEALTAQRELSEARTMRDELLAARADDAPARSAGATEVVSGAGAVAEQLRAQADRAAELGRTIAQLSQQIAALEIVPVPSPAERPRSRPRRPTAGRRPLALPGGVYGSSVEAAEHLVRSHGAAVLVDGYNVAKLAWPALDLDHQRQRCVEASEDVARRLGADITVVFDGASVVGATGRRTLVRVVFSPAGVSADDVIRAEVAARPTTVAVVVITNDAAIVADVRAAGANVVSSEQWLELARR